MFRLQREFREFGQKRGAVASLELERFVHVRYRDIWGDAHDEVYRVNSLTAARVPDAEAKQILRAHDDGTWIEFPQATIERIHARWTELWTELMRAKRVR